MQYEHLVRKCLRTYGLLCLGVYRLLDEFVDDFVGERTVTQKRYVITHPPKDFLLIETDRVLITYVVICYLLAGCRQKVLNLISRCPKWVLQLFRPRCFFFGPGNGPPTTTNVVVAVVVIRFSNY